MSTPNIFQRRGNLIAESIAISPLNNSDILLKSFISRQFYLIGLRDAQDAKVEKELKMEMELQRRLGRMVDSLFSPN